MKKNLLLTALVLLLPSFALAHVSVRPRESKPGAEEQYTVRVPTEGTVATTHAVLEIPADVTVLEVLPTEGATFETATQGNRITAITWRKAIPPKAAAEFVFRARNPAAGDIVWKAHQHFSDGTVADWIGIAGDKRPASVTKLSAQAAGGAPSGDATAIEAWLKGYDAAFNAKDLDKFATFYYPDVTIYEGGGINNGWIDYRDRHLGPELKAFENLQFGHSNAKVSLLPGGQSAYATSEYVINAKMASPRTADNGRALPMCMQAHPYEAFSPLQDRREESPSSGRSRCTVVTHRAPLWARMPSGLLRSMPGLSDPRYSCHNMIL